MQGCFLWKQIRGHGRNKRNHSKLVVMFTTIDRYCSECLTYANSFNPHTPMKSGVTMNSHFTDETAEAHGDEMAWPRLNG